MALSMDTVLFSALAAHVLALDHSGAQSTMMSNVSNGIRGQAAAGNFTATYDASAQTSKDVQYLLEALRSSGYGATLSTTNIIITW